MKCQERFPHVEISNNKSKISSMPMGFAVMLIDKKQASSILHNPTSVLAVPILQTKTSLCQKPLRFFIDLCIYLFLQPFKNRAARRFQTSFKLQICKSFS